MTLLLENPLPIWSAGAVFTTLCLVLVLARRSLASIIALVVVIAITLLLVLAEEVVVTEREKVEESILQLTNALEVNDLAAVLALVDPSANKVRADAESLMPQVKIKDAGATAIRIELDETAVPLQATAFFRGRVDGVHTRSGGRVFYFDQLEIDWQKTADQWLILNYRVFQKGQAIDAVKSVRGNRPVR